MLVGVGLPSAIPGVDGETLVEWSRRADEGPFASLAAIDRVAYDTIDPIVALSVAAGATKRIQLATTILIAPLRNTRLLAKQLASLDRVSAGRLVLGVGIGARHDDYELTAVERATRGRRLDEQLADLNELFGDGVFGLHGKARRRLPLLVGGNSSRALARMAWHADGYVHGGGPPRVFARAAEQAREAWTRAGRDGAPQLWGQAYFALGAEAERGRSYVRDYYAFTGPFAEKLAGGVLTTPDEVKAFVAAYAESGCDHLSLFPAVADPGQLEQLREVLEADVAAAT